VRARLVSGLKHYICSKVSVGADRSLCLAYDVPIFSFNFSTSFRESPLYWSEKPSEGKNNPIRVLSLKKGNRTDSNMQTEYLKLEILFRRFLDGKKWQIREAYAIDNSSVAKRFEKNMHELGRKVGL